MTLPRRIPAVVVGGTLNSLGVVRSLAEAAVPTFVLDTSRSCAAAWSRYARFIRVQDLEGDGLLRGLISLSTRLKHRPVLILTADQSVETVSLNRETIQSLYRISLPTHEMVLALADKTLFHEYAEREGFPVPCGVALTRLDELERLATLTPPIMLKPASKSLVLKGMVERGIRAETVQEARRVAAGMLGRAGHVLAQEWIAGADSEIFFVLFSCGPDGRPIGLFVGRKLVCSPPAIGSTAVCVASDESVAELLALTQRFIERTQYRGLGSLEFKRESATGRFQIVEPTVGRTDWQEEIATLCGQNLPLLTYRVETGDSEVPAEHSNEHTSRDIAWRASMAHRSRPDPSRPRVAQIDGYFRWSDPVPALYHYGHERFVRRIWRRGIQQLQRAASAS